jgi:hypothetical protein
MHFWYTATSCAGVYAVPEHEMLPPAGTYALMALMRDWHVSTTSALLLMVFCVVMMVSP